MRYRAYLAGVASTAARFGVLGIIAGQILLVPIAYATETTINANVCGTSAGTLHISSPVSGSTVNTPNVVVKGTVSNLSQIRAYNNDSFHETIPLDAGSTVFTYTTNLVKGQNTIKLIGVDPCNANGPEGSLSLTFDPAASPSTLAQAVEQTSTTAHSAADYIGNQVAQAAQTAPAVGLSGVVFTVMQGLDLAPVADSTQSMARMTQRFTAVTSGVALVLFAQPVLAAAHFMQSQVLQWNAQLLPAAWRRRAPLVLRLIGAGLLAAGFLL